MRTLAIFAAALAAGFALAPAAPAAEASRRAGDLATAAKVLDAFHSAASRADEAAYFELLAPNAVFFGTDAGERWDKEAFRAFAHPYFSRGKGWTFVPHDRHLDASRAGDVIWFDEKLSSESYGDCRGTGVLERQPDGAWRITQYHLTIPIPNDLAKEFVARIREAAKPKP